MEQVIPFEVNAAGWVDGASAERHIAIPGDGSMSFTESRGFTFADGSVAIQTLSLPIDSDSAKKRRVETRLLVRQDGTWNDPQSSILYQRISRRGRGQMPPLSTQVVEQRAVELFSEWIKSIPPLRKFVRDWTVDDIQREIDRLPAPGVQAVENGRKVFNEAGCAQCHRRSNVGGGAGPDSTNLAQRRKLAEVLESIVSPSKDISPEFSSIQIATTDGQVVVGRIEREDENVVVVRTTNSFQAPVEILRENIEARATSSLSSMPSSLLDTLEMAQIIELVAFLMESASAK
jgi:putative heme-binding domain-containing protein